MSYNPTNFSLIGDAKTPYFMFLKDFQMIFYIVLCFLGSGVAVPKAVDFVIFESVRKHLDTILLLEDIWIDTSLQHPPSR